VDTSEIDVGHDTERYRYDEPAVAQMKFYLNFVLPPALKGRAISRIFAQEVEEERTFCEHLYMNRQEIRELHRRTGGVGLHSYNHQPLAVMETDDSYKDIRKNLALLQEIIGEPPISISYPFGGADAVSDDIEKICRNLGLVLGFTTERSFNRTLQRPLLFARVDTNDALGGKMPMMLVKNNQFSIQGSMSLHRQLYFDEAA